MSLPHFQYLFAVSDLHLGGREGFQVFDQGPALAWVIDHLRQKASTENLALILNGDIVDFLAEEPSRYLDAENAVSKLSRIIQDPSFSPVWKALTRFVRKPKRHLVLVLGNHDVELALPEVQQLLRETLCGASESARGRLSFAMDGNGYACTVGKAKVLCIHGNEADSWNAIDYLALNQTIRAQNRGMPLPDWTPNAGTKMVIDVMNDIKSQYRWVDLLKPEVQAVPALLVALNPKVLAKLRLLPGLVIQLGIDSMRRHFHLLSGEEAKSENEQVHEFEQYILKTFYPKQEPSEGRLMLARIIADLENDVAADFEPMMFLEEETSSNKPEVLGFSGALWDLIRGRTPKDNMRKALVNWLTEDTTWRLDRKDSAFEAVDKLIGDDIDFTLVGHTHLRRAILRDHGRSFYFNSGTWIRLMAITPAMLDEDDLFDKLWQILEDGKMTVLDDPSQIGITDFQVVKRIRTVIGIETDEQGQVHGRLYEVNGEADFTLDPVANSHHIHP